MKKAKLITTFILVLILASVVTGVASADDIDDPAPPPTLTVFPGPFNSPSWEATVNNGDGTYTFSQAINNASTSPHYTAPSSGGFGIYSWYDEDYGWQHNFDTSHPDLLILEATLTIRAWDVDSETFHGWNGEFDGIFGDGVYLDPQYLQGTNGTWSVTVFNVDPATLMDGFLDVWIDIDMHHTYRRWATTLDYSRLDVTYTSSTNQPPYQPDLSISPDGCVADGDDLVVTVTGPSPADPDGDPVSYEYRWFVDTGTGFYVDDEFAGRGDHTGNTVPGADTVLGDKWKVDVTPIGTFTLGSYTIEAHGPAAEAVFGEIVASCNLPPVFDPLPTPDYYGDEGSGIPLSGITVTDPDGDPLTFSWSVDNPGLCTFDDATILNPTLTCDDNGAFVATLTASDGQDTTSISVNVYVSNVPPTVSIDSVLPILVPVLAPVTADGSYTDPGAADTHIAVWKWGDGVEDIVDPSASPLTGIHAYTTPGIYTIELQVTDDDGGMGTDAFYSVVVYDPSGGFVTGGGWINSPYGALRLDTELPFFNGSYYEIVYHSSLSWTDANILANATVLEGCLSSHLVTITSQDEQDALYGFFDGALQGKWYGGYQDEGTTVPDEGWNWVTGEPWDYTNWAPGEPNDYGGPGAEQHLLGWLGGWAWNDEGNLANVTGHVVEHEQCGPTGKASFGFVSKYKKGATTPDGNTEFQFHAAGLNFHSTSYEWLVVTGSDYAMFKGEGTINGAGTYKFKLWAGDDTPDTFRIKIWEEDEYGVEAVIYDNGHDQPIENGSIIVHKK